MLLSCGSLLSLSDATPGENGSYKSSTGDFGRVRGTAVEQQIALSGRGGSSVCCGGEGSEARWTLQYDFLRRTWKPSRSSLSRVKNVIRQYDRVEDAFF